MYSPKIAEDLIPILYCLARELKIPMTKIVDNILRKALANQENRIKESNDSLYKQKEV